METQPPPFEPTDAFPGSEEKISVLRRRWESGLPLWHPEDVRIATAWEVLSRRRLQDMIDRLKQLPIRLHPSERDGLEVIDETGFEGQGCRRG